VTALVIHGKLLAADRFVFAGAWMIDLGEASPKPPLESRPGKAPSILQEANRRAERSPA